jgi:hypothetical protein
MSLARAAGGVARALPEHTRRVLRRPCRSR